MQPADSYFGHLHWTVEKSNIAVTQCPVFVCPDRLYCSPDNPSMGCCWIAATISGFSWISYTYTYCINKPCALHSFLPCLRCSFQHNCHNSQPVHTRRTQVDLWVSKQGKQLLTIILLLSQMIKLFICSSNYVGIHISAATIYFYNTSFSSCSRFSCLWRNSLWTLPQPCHVLFNSFQIDYCNDWWGTLWWHGSHAELIVPVLIYCNRAHWWNRCGKSANFMCLYNKRFSKSRLLEDVNGSSVHCESVFDFCI